MRLPPFLLNSCLMSEKLYRPICLLILSPLVFGACGGLTSDLLATGSDQPTSSSASNSNFPIPTPGLSAGNNWLDVGLSRADITSDSQDPTDVQAGVPIVIALELFDYGVNPNGTTPLAGAQVDIWHPNAVGDYSGDKSVRTTRQDWLRGYQVSDAKGQVTFNSIFPAGPPGRTPHVNLRVRTASQTGSAAYNFTTELYFDPSVATAFLQDANYTYRTLPDVTNAADPVYGGPSLSGPITTLVGAQLLMTSTDNKTFQKSLLLNTKDTFYTGGTSSDPNALDPNGVRKLRDPKRLNISSSAAATYDPT